MWMTLLGQMALCALFLFVPGFLISSLFIRRAPLAVACAPGVSLAVYAILSAILTKAGVSCSWILLAGLALGLGVASALVQMGRRRSHGGNPAKARGTARHFLASDWPILLLYLLVGLVSMGSFFVSGLESPESFIQEYDGVHHLATIRSFLNSGEWSSLGGSLYADAAFEPPYSTEGFYPSAWHVLVAMVFDAAPVSLATTVNAVNVVFSALVFPAGSFFLLRQVFQGDRAALVCGAFCTMGFAAFPWKLLLWGPLFPNLVSFCLMPAVASLFVLVVDELGQGWRRALGRGLLFALMLVALALSQPSAIFTLMVFLVPFCTVRIARCAGGTSRGRKATVRALAAGAAFLLAAACLWFVCYKLPFMASTVSFRWEPFVGKKEALLNVLVLSMRDTNPQVLLGILVLVGVGALLVAKKLRWLVASYAIVCAMYVVCASTSGTLKQVMCGFWYTDPTRIAAMVAMFAVPLASMGLATLGSLISKVVLRFCPSDSSKLPRAVAVLLVALSVAIIYLPSNPFSSDGENPTAFEGIIRDVAFRYGDTWNVLDADEQRFLKQVEDIVGDEDLVINEPNDGSAYAYGLDDLNLYYRLMYGHGGESESPESALIRESLSDIADNGEVRDAVDKIGADYVLQLDHDDREWNSRYLWSYFEEDWPGIDGIDDDTPGFELVLSDGDRRLYRIEK